MTPVFRAVGCTRVSSKRQAEEGFSLEEQSAAIRAFCERQGLYLVEILEDRAKTGRVKERPAIVRMLQLAEAKAFDVLIMVKVDRAGRQNRIIQEIIGEVQDRGIRVHFIEGGAGDTAEGRFLLNVLGGMAEYNWEQLRTSTMQARRRKAQSGRIPIRLELFGYHQVSKAEAAVKPECQGRDGELEPVPEEARWIPELFQRFAAGTSANGLATWLNEAGVPTKTGGRWRAHGIRRLLQNRTYVGTFIYGRAEHRGLSELTAGGNFRKRVTVASPDRHVHIPVPPLLVDAEGKPDFALFAQVQQRLEESHNAFAGRPTTVWLLSGLVFCGSCVTEDGRPRRCGGNRVSNSRDRPGYLYRQYRCQATPSNGAKYCGIAYPANQLEEKVRAELLAATEPGELARRARALVEAQRAGHDDPAAELERLNTELKRLDDGERKIVDLALQGLSDHIVAEKLAQVKQERSRLTVRLRAVEERLWSVGDLEGVEAQAEAASRQIRAMLDDPDPAVQQQALRAAISVSLWKDQEPQITVRVEGALGLGNGLATSPMGETA